MYVGWYANAGTPSPFLLSTIPPGAPGSTVLAPPPAAPAAAASTAPNPAGLGYYGGSSFPVPQPQSAGPLARFPGSGLGYYGTRFRRMGRIPGGFGQTDILGVTVDPTLLALGGAALLAAIFLMGRKTRPYQPGRRIARRISRRLSSYAGDSL